MHYQLPCMHNTHTYGHTSYLLKIILTGLLDFLLDDNIKNSLIFLLESQIILGKVKKKIYRGPGYFVIQTLRYFIYVCHFCPVKDLCPYLPFMFEVFIWKGHASVLCLKNACNRAPLIVTYGS